MGSCGVEWSLFVVSNVGNNPGHWETGDHSGTNDTERGGRPLQCTYYPVSCNNDGLHSKYPCHCHTQHAATLHPVSGEMIADYCNIIWPRNPARSLWPGIASNHKCNQIHLLLVTVGLAMKFRDPPQEIISGLFAWQLNLQSPIKQNYFYSSIKICFPQSSRSKHLSSWRQQTIFCSGLTCTWHLYFVKSSSCA